MNCQSNISPTCTSQDVLLVSTDSGKDSGAEALRFLQTASPLLSWEISDLSLHLLWSGMMISNRVSSGHLHMYTVHWRPSLLHVNEPWWQSFWRTNDLNPSSHYVLVSASCALGEHEMTCALEAGFISCLPAMIWKFWWALESFTQTFHINKTASGCQLWSKSSKKSKHSINGI